MKITYFNESKEIKFSSDNDQNIWFDGTEFLLEDIILLPIHYQTVINLYDLCGYQALWEEVYGKE